MSLTFSEVARMESYENVCSGITAEKSWSIVIAGPPVDIMEHTTLLRRYLILGFIGPPFLKMLPNMSKNVIHAKERETFHPEMKCHNIVFKCAKYLTYGGSISWDHFPCQKATNVYWWRWIMNPNGRRHKHYQLMMLGWWCDF